MNLHSIGAAAQWGRKGTHIQTEKQTEKLSSRGKLRVGWKDLCGNKVSLRVKGMDQIKLDLE